MLLKCMASALDPREIRHLVHCSTEMIEQGKSRLALCRVRIVHRDIVEERIDRPPQRRKRGHGLLETFVCNSAAGRGFGPVQRLDQRGFGRFGVVIGPYMTTLRHD